MEKKDRAVLIGNDAPEMAKGIRENGASCEQVLILSDVECARPIVEEFEGVVLFKGSRSFRLESLVPSWAVEKIESGVALSC